MRPPFQSCSERTLLALLYLAASLLVLLPLATVKIPALVDYLNHLARIHILLDLDSSPQLQAIYTLNWPPPPYLLGDLLLAAIAKLTGLFPAGRLYLAICFALIIGGVASLRHALHGRVGGWPLPAFLLLYGAGVDWGFLSYLLGLGLSINALALWVRSAPLRLGWRWAVLSLLTLLLYYAHAFSMLGFLLMVAAHEAGIDLGAGWRDRVFAIVRKWLVMGSAVLPVLVLIVLTYQPVAGERGIRYGDPAHKVNALLSPVGMGLEWLDPLALAFLLLVLAVPVLRGWIAPPMRWVAGAVLLAALLMPHGIDETFFLDYRLPVLLFLIVLAGVEGRPVERRFKALGIAVLFALLTARSLAIQERWRQGSARTEEMIAAASLISKGAAVLPVRQFPVDEAGRDAPLWEQVRTRSFDRHDWHLTNAFVIERDAFNPLIFNGMNVLRVRDRYAGSKPPQGVPLTTELFLRPVWLNKSKGRREGEEVPVYWGRWPERFNYVLLLNTHWEKTPFAGLLELVHRGSYFELYRVTNGSLGWKP